MAGPARTAAVDGPAAAAVPAAAAPPAAVLHVAPSVAAEAGVTTLAERTRRAGGRIRAARRADCAARAGGARLGVRRTARGRGAWGACIAAATEVTSAAASRGDEQARAQIAGRRADVR